MQVHGRSQALALWAVSRGSAAAVYTSRDSYVPLHLNGTPLLFLSVCLFIYISLLHKGTSSHNPAMIHLLPTKIHQKPAAV